MSNETLRQEDVYLPEIATKSEIAEYFGFRSVNYFWKHYWGDAELQKYGYTYEQIRSLSRLPWDLTQQIYKAYHISNLRK